MKENLSEAGLTLLEVGLFLIFFTFVLVTFVQRNDSMHYFYSSWGFSEQMLQETSFLKDYLTKNASKLNYGVSEIAPSKILPADYINTNGVNINDYSVQFYANKEKIDNLNIDSISGLVVANPRDKNQSFTKSKINLIEHLLYQYGGTGDNDIIEGNFGGWILDLHKWTEVEQAQIVAYIPAILPLTNSVSISQQMRVGAISYRICNLGKCYNMMSHLSTTSGEMIKWTPLYFDDSVTISFTETENIDYYIVSVFNRERKLIKTIATKSDLVLKPVDFPNDFFDIEIKPVSSVSTGLIQKIVLVKSLPVITVSDLWASFNISVVVGNTDGLNYSDKLSSSLMKRSGQLTTVNFTPIQDKEILYNIKLEFCGNDFIFLKKSTLSINYFNEQYEPWFLLKTKIDDDSSQRTGEISVCFNSQAVKPYQLVDGNLFLDGQLVSKENLGKQGVFETPLDELTNVINITFTAN